MLFHILIELVEELDSLIQEASLTRNYVDYVVPTDMFIAGLRKDNAQRIIYYLLAKEIIKAGYTLQLTMSPKVIFHVSWVTDMDESDTKKINDYLISLLKKRQKDQTEKKRNNDRKKKDYFYEDENLQELTDLDDLDLEDLN